MYALMFLQTALLTEGLATHDTAEWLLPTMFALMCLQMTLLIE
jgi:hypothetical protein